VLDPVVLIGAEGLSPRLRKSSRGLNRVLSIRFALGMRSATCEAPSKKSVAAPGRSRFSVSARSCVNFAKPRARRAPFRRSTHGATCDADARIYS